MLGACLPFGRLSCRRTLGAWAVDRELKKKHLSGAASLPGAERFFSRIGFFVELATCPGQLHSLERNFFSEIGLSGILELLCAEQDVGNLKRCTFKNSGTPVCRTRRQKFQKMHFQKILDTSLRRTRRRKYTKMTFKNYGNPVGRTRRRKSQKMSFQEFWDSCAQNKTSDISKNGLSGILALLCAEQDVGN